MNLLYSTVMRCYFSLLITTPRIIIIITNNNRLDFYGLCQKCRNGNSQTLKSYTEIRSPRIIKKNLSPAVSLKSITDSNSSFISFFFFILFSGLKRHKREICGRSLSISQGYTTTVSSLKHIENSFQAMERSTLRLDLQKCILCGAIKFVSVRPSQGNLRVLEITKASVLFSRHEFQMQCNYLRK